MDLVVAADDVAANMASTPTQDSAFLRLPLEIRHEIYDYLIHTKNTKTLSMHICQDPTSGLNPVTNLLGVSQQIRTEVHGLIAAVTTLEIKACESGYSTIMPHYISYKATKKFLDKPDSKWAMECFRVGAEAALRDALAKISKDEKKAPHQLKFWKVCVPLCVGRLCRETKYVANIDFRARTTRVHNPLGDESSNIPNSHDWSSEKEAFTTSMQFFTDQDRFDGITIADMSLFMEKFALSQT
ncbi:hypothetical protein KCV07_g4653, partial [Aureobasidium melanogenum]